MRLNTEYLSIHPGSYKLNLEGRVSFDKLSFDGMEDMMLMMQKPEEKDEKEMISCY